MLSENRSTSVINQTALVVGTRPTLIETFVLALKYDKSFEWATKNKNI